MFGITWLSVDVKKQFSCFPRRQWLLEQLNMTSLADYPELEELFYFLLQGKKHAQQGQWTQNIGLPIAQNWTKGKII